MGFFQDLLRGAAGGFFGSDYLRDYTHAAKTFRSNAYQYAPKFKFLFHTYFEISNTAYDFDLKETTQQNFGLLVRDIKLPSYTMQTYQMNQYNRKRIVQTKIKYDPVTITFHDDNSSLITKLWAAYYTYYYKDGANPKVIFNGKRGSNSTTDLSTPPSPGDIRGLAGAGSGKAVSPTLVTYYNRNLYEPSITGNGDWGYIGETAQPSTPVPTKAPFFKNITVFGFYDKNFIAYTLINPIITNFAHDTYNYDEGGGVMKNNMTLDYETVVYNEGAIDGRKPGDIVTGFGDNATYDRRTSPIMMPGANGTILGKGGLIDSVGGAIENLASGGDAIKAIQTIGTAYKTAGKIDVKATLKTELKNAFSKNLKSAVAAEPPKSRNLQFEFLAAGSTPVPDKTAQSPTAGAQSAPQKTTSTPPAGQQVSQSPARTGG